MSAYRSTDRISLPAGVAHLPSIFREVALRANRAGLAGWKIDDLTVGLDRQSLQAALESPGVISIHQLPEIEARIEITYAPEAAP